MLSIELSFYASMASHSGIRARDSHRGEYIRKPILKDAAGYGAWKVKMETILDADDCWEIVQGTQLEPLDLAWVIEFDEEGAVVENPRTAADVICEATYWCMKQLNSTQHNHMLKLIRIIIHSLQKPI